ncbi:MAG: CPBP family intramembrane metalloprotease [Candidatus Nezhaarchaeota archaeon]|nr:CPBP family intramembrane metalloprotease [Candidatus Nezhaarchaeota archaeon]
MLHLLHVPLHRSRRGTSRPLRRSDVNVQAGTPLSLRLAYSNAAIASVFLPAYFVLQSLLGYTYELHFFSTLTLVFAILLSAGLALIHQAHPSRSTYLALLGVYSLVFAEEFALNSEHIAYGLGLALVGVLTLPVLAASWAKSPWLRVALEASALILATRVVITPFPPAFLGLPASIPTTYTLTLAATILYLAYRRIPAKEVRFHLGTMGWLSQLAVGFSAGFVLGVAEYFILRPRLFVQGGLLQTLIYVVVVSMVFVGVTEELLFRGLLQTSLERLVDKWVAIVLASGVFGLMHVGWLNPLEVAFAYGAGVVFGFLAVKTESLLSPILAHGFGNLVLFSLALLL